VRIEAATPNRDACRPGGDRRFRHVCKKVEHRLRPTGQEGFLRCAPRSVRADCLLQHDPYPIYCQNCDERQNERLHICVSHSDDLYQCGCECPKTASLSGSKRDIARSHATGILILLRSTTHTSGESISRGYCHDARHSPNRAVPSTTRARAGAPPAGDARQPPPSRRAIFSAAPASRLLKRNIRDQRRPILAPRGFDSGTAAITHSPSIDEEPTPRLCNEILSAIQISIAALRGPNRNVASAAHAIATTFYDRHSHRRRRLANSTKPRRSIRPTSAPFRASY